jgi:hypothetical protein
MHGPDARWEAMASGRWPQGHARQIRSPILTSPVPASIPSLRLSRLPFLPRLPPPWVRNTDFACPAILAFGLCLSPGVAIVPRRRYRGQALQKWPFPNFASARKGTAAPGHAWLSREMHRVHRSAAGNWFRPVCLHALHVPPIGLPLFYLSRYFGIACPGFCPGFWKVHWGKKYAGT